MKQLTDLLENVSNTPNRDIHEVSVCSIVTDSRKILLGSLFVAVKGLSVDGHDFIKDAAIKGCVAIIVNKGCCSSLNDSELPPIIEVEDSSQALGKIASAFYGHPGCELSLIGLTGTNGKTTSTYILESILKEAGAVPGVIGTINYRYNGTVKKADFTTPEPIELQKLLREMVDKGVTHVIMEASSHALVLNRLVGLSFDVALFTNLSRDHLDFHQDMEEYFQTKKLLFTKYLRRNGIGVVVQEDSYYEDVSPIVNEQCGDSSNGWSKRLIGDLIDCGFMPNGDSHSRIITCGKSDYNHICSREYYFTKRGIKAQISIAGREFAVQSHLVGEFNLKNLLGAAGVAFALGISPKVIGRGINRMGSVPGRMEQVEIEGKEQDFSVYVDYAHTPDALENVLINLLKIADGRILVVFGCGGDRDHGKRLLMGEVAGNLADVVIITADNSRSEPTELIISEIQRGVETTGKKLLETGSLLENGFIVEPSRSRAIQRAINLAEPNDIVLISGKGHETYQITREGTVHFNDCQEARKYMAA